MGERPPAGWRWSVSELCWALPRLSRAGDGRAVGVLSVWVWWGWFLELWWRLRKVRPEGVLRFRLARHRGRAVTLRDGTVIAAGDHLVELHFDNRRLMGMTGAHDWKPWAVIEKIDGDLRQLAALTASGRLGPVRALHGVTLFGTPGRRLGFEIHPVPHDWGWSLRRFFLIGVLPIYHRDGWREFDRMRRDRWPSELWMSLDHLRQLSRPPLAGGAQGGGVN